MGVFNLMDICSQNLVFNNNQVAVTERTARRMGELYQLLYDRGNKKGFQEFSEE